MLYGQVDEHLRCAYGQTRHSKTNMAKGKRFQRATVLFVYNYLSRVLSLYKWAALADH